VGRAGPRFPPLPTKGGFGPIHPRMGATLAGLGRFQALRREAAGVGAGDPRARGSRRGETSAAEAAPRRRSRCPGFRSPATPPGKERRAFGQARPGLEATPRGPVTELAAAAVGEGLGVVCGPALPEGLDAVGENGPEEDAGDAEDRGAVVEDAAHRRELGLVLGELEGAAALAHWESPRLCRGGSSSLTVPE